jgi:hypothetical protein
MKVEDFLDQYFALDFIIERTTRYQERVQCLGDRKFIERQSKKSFYVEYKSGIQTGYTGNVFLETISVDSTCVPGWVYACQADYLLYAALLNGLILVFEPEKLRKKIGMLRQKFKEKKTSKGQNDGYDTHGVIVPLDYAKVHLASKVIKIRQ